MKFWTSDPHFGHANVIKYSNRPFADVEEMEYKLILNWNSKVKPGDEVYILGDMFFCKADNAKSIVRRLNGQKFLIYGNHDKLVRNNKELQAMFNKCADYMEVTVKIGEEKQPIVMSHYPMLTWNRAHHGSWMLHGHSHGNLCYPFSAKILDVGVDVHNYAPISLDEVAAIMSGFPINKIDHHGD